MILVLLTYFAYAALMAFNTPDILSLQLMTGERGPRSSRVSLLIPRPDSLVQVARPGTDPYLKHQGIEPYDVPLELVNLALYPSRPRPH